jgi:hypothetical protein
VRFSFERTVWWEKAAATAGTLELASDGATDANLLAALLEEDQLCGAYQLLQNAAALRHLAVAYAQQTSAALSPEYQQDVADQYRREQGLMRPVDVERWLADNGLSRERFAELLREQALLKWSFTRLAGEVARRLPDELRLHGQYATLLERARHKQLLLAQHGWLNPSLEELGLAREEALRWYFDRLGRTPPADLEDYADQAGFGDSGGLIRAVLRELCYLRCLDQEAGRAAAAPAP